MAYIDIEYITARPVVRAHELLESPWGVTTDLEGFLMTVRDFGGTTADASVWLREKLLGSDRPSHLDAHSKLIRSRHV